MAEQNEEVLSNVAFVAFLVNMNFINRMYFEIGKNTYVLILMYIVHM